MSSEWEPDKYRDEYRNAMLELIEQKAQHKERGQADSSDAQHKGG
jgi:non-homologous end joining protein Ku